MTDRDRLPAPLDQAALRAELIGTGLGWRRLDVVEETGSTNADLLAQAASGADLAGAVLIAEHQTAGRGRQGRGWSATPRTQITMSVGVSVVDVPTAGWGWLPLATGVAVVDTVAPLLDGVEVGLKWPNDVLAGLPGSPGKLAGILAEVARPVVVIGLGLNVFEAPDGIEGATSLADLGLASPDRTRVVSALLTELGRRIVAWRAARGRTGRWRPTTGRGASPWATGCGPTCPAAGRSSDSRPPSTTRAGCASTPGRRPSSFPRATWCICAS